MLISDTHTITKPHKIERRKNTHTIQLVTDTRIIQFTSVARTERIFHAGFIKKKKKHATTSIGLGFGGSERGMNQHAHTDDDPIR